LTYNLDMRTCPRFLSNLPNCPAESWYLQ